MRYVLAAFLLIVLTFVRGHAQTGAANPRFVDASELSPPQPAPQPFRMTPATQRNIAAAIRALPQFPDYLYSGCHDRAHAAYMLLPDSLIPYATKVWIFTPSRLTFVLPGTISLRDNRDRRSTQNVQWGHHVALSFLDHRGEVLVFDPSLAPGRLIGRREWFGLMRVPPYSIWTRWRADTYLFYSSEKTLASPGRILNGGTFGYTPRDSARIKHFIPRALARDAVGEAVLRGGACDALTAIVTQPDILQQRLEAGDLPGDCAPQQELFTREVSRWIRVLGEEEPTVAEAVSGSGVLERAQQAIKL